ncbi:hypothetical protein BOW53_15570 [Solemya pervernicosa gill symbiont]|uniref:Uncharacterized protein n=2 Tax=Gammaproteobacteria incertae sedis TaxID=118884 RepID=A0A1T2L006_9GAMM|nr:hypothetical protein [Candidatus Reidiella endopervernicosa]OOZ38433.1 hypothetical protein BOW53_15570 [Solemya pervernicosa gill symbiont]QKQ27861.1 hypothetical protein HUE57_17425 [Candidatus Reidiella endopervernicosa]
MQAPNISTAIPQRRFQLGDYSAVVLGNIESNDPMPYRFILALVPEGAKKPVLYVISQKARRADAASGSHQLRIVSENLDESISVSDLWGDLDGFTTEAMLVTRKAMGLMDEQPYQMM